MSFPPANPKKPMNDKDHAVSQALGRVNRFAAAHAAAFPAGSHARNGFARAEELAAALVAGDDAPGVPASPATAARNHLFAELWEDLKAIAGTARTIDRQEPGFATAFRLGGDTQRETFAAATAFLEKLQAPEVVAKFTAYDLPADFVADLAADLAAIEAAGGRQADDRIAGIGDTARTRSLVQEARELIATLNTSVRNRFRAEPEILAEWLAASRIHRTGRGGGPVPPEAPSSSPLAG